MRYLLILIVLAVAACSGKHDLPVASGPVFQLNDGQWTATADELRVPAWAAR